MKALVDRFPFPFGDPRATALVDLLAELYSGEDDARNFAQSCGLDPKQMKSGQSPINRWHHYVELASANGLLRALVEKVRDRFPKNPKVNVLDAVLALEDEPATINNPLVLWVYALGLLLVVGLGIGVWRIVVWVTAEPQHLTDASVAPAIDRSTAPLVSDVTPGSGTEVVKPNGSNQPIMPVPPDPTPDPPPDPMARFSVGITTPSACRSIHFEVVSVGPTSNLQVTCRCNSGQSKMQVVAPLRGAGTPSVAIRQNGVEEAAKKCSP